MLFRSGLQISLNYFDWVAPVLLADIMVLSSLSCAPSSPSNRLKRSLSPMVPEVIPIVEKLAAEELDAVSLLVLWPNFDEDNIELFPCGWLGSWGTEEEEGLSRILRVCMRVMQRRFLARRDLSWVVEAIYAAVVHW